MFRLPGYPTLLAYPSLRGGTRRTGDLQHVICSPRRKCGIAYAGTGSAHRTCRVTEPPYYSMCVCNGLRSSRTKVLRETGRDTSGRQHLRRSHCLGGREAAFSETNKPNTRLC